MSCTSSLSAPAAPAAACNELLLRFNRQVLDQALDLVAAHWLPGAPDYAYPVGAHVRHVVEHFEALLFPAAPGVVDYDARARDGELERNPVVAAHRLQVLREALSQVAGTALTTAVQVHGLGGLGGEFQFSVPSTIGRELVFVASHAIHHFALLRAHCAEQGITSGETFGKAPGTVAHERAQRRDLAVATHASQPETETS
jgi:hypothetical protein